MSQKPNVLFILSDQHSAEYLGGKQAATPYLDALARESVCFDAAYCQNPLCVPSRATLLTGRYCRSTGIYDNRHILESNLKTMPRAFTEAGYTTCVVGKTHFNGEQFQGYQRRPYGDLFGQAHQPDPRRLPEGGESGLGPVIANAGPTGIPIAMTQTEICVSESVKFLQTHMGTSGGRPFFLSVHFDKPHFPNKPPRELYEKYSGKMTLPSYPPDSLERSVNFVRAAVEANGCKEHYNCDEEIHLRALAAYAACVEWTDSAAGRVIDALDYLGLAENTVVIYSSDHGEMAGCRGYWQKSVFYEQSARVPLLIRAPGGIKGGCDVPVGLIDLYPTLCDLAGISIPDVCEGASLAPLLTGSGSISRDGVYCESTVYKRPEHAGCMLRRGRYKYNRYLDNDDELYDMQEDPGEMLNLVRLPEFAALAREMRGAIDDFWKPEQQMQRFYNTPMMLRDKHHYEFSNQFMLGDGTVVDARP